VVKELSVMKKDKLKNIIREIMLGILKEEYKGPIKKCPKCEGDMHYDDGSDAYICTKCKHK
jgi:acetyl-CoA carboxylase beta subunit